MNNYNKVITVLRNILDSNEDIKTVIHGQTEVNDIYKRTIFPCAHIVPLAMDLNTPNWIKFQFDIAALDVRDISNQPTEDKFYGNDNEVDNLNVGQVVLTQLITRLRLQDNDQVEIDTVGTARPLLLKDKSLLDGWVIQLTVKVPNSDVRVC